jgi:4-hydroxythreonine-4-phosphate dehydrogenase
MNETAQLLALSMGDPCGIGPEVIAKSFARPLPAACVVVGDVAVMCRAIAVCDLQWPVAELDEPEQARRAPPRCIAVWQPRGCRPVWPLCRWAGCMPMPAERLSPCIEAAAGLTLAGRASALVTAPVHKQALAAAGSRFPGHTEMLQALATASGPQPEVRMMLGNDELRVVLVTIHVSLRQAIEQLSVERIATTIALAHRAGQRAGLAKPRIAVAGLNPHAGEGGLFGDEESRFILPAIETARAAGIDASGPYAPDTVFMRARHAPGHSGEFDYVVAMTHDHGLIPVKYPRRRARCQRDTGAAVRAHQP